MTSAEWSVLQATPWTPGHVTESVGAPPPDATWYHVSFLWPIVSMAAYLQAKASAHTDKHILYYAKALDLPTREITKPEVYKEMLA